MHLLHLEHLVAEEDEMFIFENVTGRSEAVQFMNGLNFPANKPWFARQRKETSIW